MAKDQGPIKKSDIITDEALKAPLELAENFDSADKQINKLVTDVKKIGASVPKQNSITDMQKVLKTLADQEKQIIDLQKKLNDSFKNPAPKQYSSAMQQLRADLKAAKSEMITIASTLGETSEEFQIAARKAGELKDQLDDVADAAKNASGDTAFERLGSQTSLLGTKLKNLDFKGAAAQIKAISVTSKGLTFKEATDGIGSFGKSILSLGKALLTNPIFLIAAAIALIVTAIVKLKDNVKFLDDAFQFVGKGIQFVLDIGKKFLDFLGLSSFALEARTDKIIANSAKEREAIQRRYDAEIAIASAAGKEVVDLEIAKQEAIIKTLSITIFAIDQELQHNKNLTKARKEELSKQRKDLFDLLEDASVALQIANIKEIDGAKKKNKELRDAAYELQKFRLEQAIAANDLIAKNTDESEIKRVNSAREAQELRNQLADLNKKHELDQEKLKVDEIKLINERAAAEKFKAEQQEFSDENKIFDDEDKKRRERNAENLADFKKAFFERIKIMKVAIADEQTLMSRALDLELRNIKEQVISGTLTKQQGEEAITRIVKEQSTLRIQAEIDAIKKTLATVDLSIDERKQLSQKLYDFEADLLNATYEQQIDLLPKQLAAIKQGYDALYGSLSSLFQAFSDNRMAEIQAQQDAIDKQLKDSLAAAGDNQKLKDQIQRDAEVKQNQLDRRRKDAQRKQAQFEKQLALVQATIALSQAIVEAYTAGPGIGQALAIVTAAAGAIQIAAIASRKIPSYATGGKNVPGGVARVSEEGPELVHTKDGKMFLTPDKESFIDIPAGSDIYTAKDTMRAFAKAGLNGMNERAGTRQDAMLQLFGRKVDELKSVIKANKGSGMDVRRAEKLLKSGETSIKYLMTKYK